MATRGQILKLGILGGTFNPTHIGHLIAAEEVYWSHRLSMVLFIPSYLPPHKGSKNLAEARHRYEMVRLAIKGNKHFAVSDTEITRKEKSYTIETVELLLRQYGGTCDLHLIIGADTVQELPSWKEIGRLASLCRIVVVNRPGAGLEGFSQLIPVLGKEKVEEMQRMSVQIPPVGISSTEIRARLREGRQIKYLVPDAVEKYILKKGLYRDVQSNAPT
ncbi:MAG TPA: nicotinate-nucleotide adenylyltransferase [Candidatus Hypogeohydataceae bacterium YC41]